MPAGHRYLHGPWAQKFRTYWTQHFHLSAPFLWPQTSVNAPAFLSLLSQNPEQSVTHPSFFLSPDSISDWKFSSSSWETSFKFVHFVYLGCYYFSQNHHHFLIRFLKSSSFWLEFLTTALFPQFFLHFAIRVLLFAPACPPPLHNTTQWFLIDLRKSPNYFLCSVMHILVPGDWHAVVPFLTIHFHLPCKHMEHFLVPQHNLLPNLLIHSRTLSLLPIPLIWL